jgi:transposase-like protein
MRRGTREGWQAIVEQWEASGESTKEFCERAGVNFCTFSTWRRRVAREKREIGFVEVGNRHPIGGAITGSKMRLVIGEMTLEIESPVDETGLQTVLAVLERRKC